MGVEGVGKKHEVATFVLEEFKMFKSGTSFTSSDVTRALTSLAINRQGRLDGDTVRNALRMLVEAGSLVQSRSSDNSGWRYERKQETVCERFAKSPWRKLTNGQIGISDDIWRYVR